MGYVVLIFCLWHFSPIVHLFIFVVFLIISLDRGLWLTRAHCHYSDFISHQLICLFYCLFSLRKWRLHRAKILSVSFTVECSAPVTVPGTWRVLDKCWMSTGFPFFFSKKTELIYAFAAFFFFSDHIFIFQNCNGSFCICSHSYLFNFWMLFFNNVVSSGSYSFAFLFATR